MTFFNWLFSAFDLPAKSKQPPLPKCPVPTNGKTSKTKFSTWALGKDTLRKEENYNLGLRIRWSSYRILHYIETGKMIDTPFDEKVDVVIVK